MSGGILYLKIKSDRAGAQLKELDARLADFVKSKPYTVSRYDDIQNLRHIIRIEIKVPEILGMLAGEFAYSLRSGLDQLAWQLALLHTKPKMPRTHTSFPILAKIPIRAIGHTDATRDIIRAAIPVIESLQPYNRETAFQSHPLWILNELCITDKHMIVPVNSATIRGELKGALVLGQRHFDNGFEMSVPLSDQFYVQLNPDPPEIVFGEPINIAGNRFEVRIADLRAIYNFVRDEVIPRFAGFFP